MPNELWAHQERAIDDVKQAIVDGHRGICLAAPTGMGKSRCGVELALWALDQGWNVALYSARRIWTDQWMRVLDQHNIRYGVVAAEYEGYTDLDAPVQICSSPTVYSRVIKHRKKHGYGLTEAQQRQQWSLPYAQLVEIDELHLQKSEVVTAIAREYIDLGAAVVGMTATPVGVSHICPHLVVAGTKHEGREIEPPRGPALLPAITYCCPEIDASKCKRLSNGEFAIGDVRKQWTQAIYGCVVKEYSRINPERKPALLMAPGVEESIWFTDYFNRAGIPAAHIDGNDCYVDGQRFKSNQAKRDEIIGRLRDGNLKVVCNRFVLREAVDLPWLYHMILATPIGSIVTYTQVVGRVLRGHPSLDHVVIQDHGGSWWRHPDPNDDIPWEDYFDTDLSANAISATRSIEIRKRVEEGEVAPQPCSNCGAALKDPRFPCYACGSLSKRRRGRAVLMRNGDLREMQIKEWLPRRIDHRPDALKRWEKIYFSQRRCGHTFSQAIAWYAKKSYMEGRGWVYPPEDLPLMPRQLCNMVKKISDVSKDKLISHEEYTSKQRGELRLF